MGWKADIVEEIGKWRAEYNEHNDRANHILHVMQAQGKAASASQQDAYKWHVLQADRAAKSMSILDSML